MLVALVDHDRDLGSIPIMFVVMRKLKMPLEFSRIGVQGQQSIAVEVVARAAFAAIRWRRIAGRPKDQLRGASVDSSDPVRRAASFIRLAFPRFLAGLTASGNRIKAPFSFSGLGFV